jgi:hypothetical protein
MGLAPPGDGNWILSVGATPTAHAATQIEQGKMNLEGVLELYVTSRPPALSLHIPPLSWYASNDC